jgi:hypothetical protein
MLPKGELAAGKKEVESRGILSYTEEKFRLPF